jgi:hypothetical protein
MFLVFAALAVFMAGLITSNATVAAIAMWLLVGACVLEVRSSLKDTLNVSSMQRTSPALTEEV